MHTFSERDTLAAPANAAKKKPSNVDFVAPAPISQDEFWQQDEVYKLEMARLRKVGRCAERLPACGRCV